MSPSGRPSSALVAMAMPAASSATNATSCGWMATINEVRRVGSCASAGWRSERTHAGRTDNTATGCDTEQRAEHGARHAPNTGDGAAGVKRPRNRAYHDHLGDGVHEAVRVLAHERVGVPVARQRRVCNGNGHSEGQQGEQRKAGTISRRQQTGSKQTEPTAADSQRNMRNGLRTAGNGRKETEQTTGKIAYRAFRRAWSRRRAPPGAQPAAQREKRRPR